MPSVQAAVVRLVEVPACNEKRRLAKASKQVAPRAEAGGGPNEP